MWYKGVLFWSAGSCLLLVVFVAAWAGIFAFNAGVNLGYKMAGIDFDRGVYNDQA